MSDVAMLTYGVKFRQPGEFVEKAGLGACYTLSRPVTYTKLNSLGTVRTYKTLYVWVSTSSVFGLETYIFPCTSKGKIITYSELPGSEKLTASHARVLANAGFELCGYDPSGLVAK